MPNKKFIFKTNQKLFGLK